MDTILSHQIRGQVRAHQVTESLWVPTTSSKDKELWTPTTPLDWNLILRQWGQALGKLLATGNQKYRIAGMYLEFENVAAPGDPVSVPTFDRDRTVTYYDDLAVSAVRDYLRVPLFLATYTDAADGTVCTYFARSSGAIGVHGKTFSDTVNSTIFGASLVSFVDPTDATQDLLISSYYFDVPDQQQKLSTSQVGLEWLLDLQ